MVTGVPTGPEVGDRLVMLGGVVSVKLTALLARPATVTSTLPVAAPLGTGGTMVVGVGLVGVAAVPLKLTVQMPCVDPKFVPVMVTEGPTGPERGDDAGGAPPGGGGRCAVEGDGTSSLSRPEIRSGDGDRGADGAGGGRQAGDAGDRGHGEAHSIAGKSGHGDQHIAGGGTAGYRGYDAGGAPVGRRGRRAVEGDGTRSLSRPEIRSGDGDRGTHGAGGGRQAGDAGRRGQREAHSIAGKSGHGGHDAAGGRSEERRVGNECRARGGGGRHGEVEGDRTKYRSRPEIRRSEEHRVGHEAGGGRQADDAGRRGQGEAQSMNG